MGNGKTILIHEELLRNIDDCIYLCDRVCMYHEDLLGMCMCQNKGTSQSHGLLYNFGLNPNM